MKKIELGRLVNGLLKPFGLYMVRTRNIVSRPLNSNFVFGRLKSRDIAVNTVIDVGASNGAWSTGFQRYYPEANYFLIEANEFHREGLDRFIEEHPGSGYVLAAAGDVNGELWFDDAKAFGGVAAHQDVSGHMKRLKSVTIDEEVAKRGLQGPFLIKLDTHGFEVPILKGAGQTLQQTEIVVMEAYNFRLSKDCLTLWEMCTHMQALGFHLADFLEPLHRPKDDILWQVDLIFLRAERPEFQDNQYD